MKFFSKLLSLLLAVAVIISAPLSVMAEETGTQDSGSGKTPLEMTELDPSRMNVPRLGRIRGKDEEPEKPSADPEDPEKIVRVSVVMDKNSTIDQGYSLNSIADNRGAVYYRSFLKRKQDEMVSRIEAAIGRQLEVKRNLTLLVNAVSCYVKVKEIPVIAELSGVKAVERENQYTSENDSAAVPMTANTSYGVVGASEAWEAGYTGAGLRIAIIDSGIDLDHMSFDADAFEASIKEHDETYGTTTDLLDEKEVEALAAYLNSQTGYYVSSKIPYAFNYVDWSLEVDHLGDRQSAHGSHVAGIAAGNRYVYVDDELKDAVDEVYAVGMAPDAQLIVMKVFGKNGGAYDSDYMTAIEDAAVLGCDVCNLSLGSSDQGFTYHNTYQAVFNSLADNDIMVVTISAGNASALTEYLGRDLYIEDVNMHTGGSPGTYINSLGVASAENIGETGIPLRFGSRNFFYTESDSGADRMITLAGSHDFVYIDALGTPEDYAAVNAAAGLEGKVVIVNRGDITFVEKGNNAIEYGPAAVIIANNVPGTFGMALDDYTGSAPMVSITMAAADYLRENYEEHEADGITYYTGEITVVDTVVKGTELTRDEVSMSDFSSWGVPGSLLMKPEITAPGGNVYSVYGYSIDKSGGLVGGNDQYIMMSGTSMAAPHIAGLSALLAQHVDEDKIEVDGLSRRALVQSLLMSTATPMKDGEGYVSVLQQGSGLVEVSKAMNASSVIKMTDAALTTFTKADADGKVKVELGDDPSREGVYSYSFRVYNISDDILFFTDPVTDVFTQDYYDVSDEEAEVYEVPAGRYMDRATVSAGSQTEFTWTPNETDPSVLNPYDVNQDGLTNGQDAQCVLDYLTGKISGDGLDLEAGDADEDGKLTTYDAHRILLFTEDVMTGNYIPAGGYADVTITFSFSVDDEVYVNGAYVEGFTSLTEKTDTEGVVGVTHSIPILGFYGDWTDPSMFDAVSYNDLVYMSDREPYAYDDAGNYYLTNYMGIKQNGEYYAFTGNPYVAEGEFPYDRLAITGDTSVEDFCYTLIRAAAAEGLAIAPLEERGGELADLYYAGMTAYDEVGIWYDEEKLTWMNTQPRSTEVVWTPESFGFEEGDIFRIGFYAFPEYTGMMYSGADLTDPDAGHLDVNTFAALLMAGYIGNGSSIGYDLMVDNTAPEIIDAVLEGDTVTVSFEDNQNLAFVGLVSVDGETVYEGLCPAGPVCSMSFDISEYRDEVKGYVAVFAGDYAGNEAAKAVKVNDRPTIEEKYYFLTETMVDGGRYVIANTFETTDKGFVLSADHEENLTYSEQVSIWNYGTSDAPDSMIYGDQVKDESVWTLTIKDKHQYIFSNGEDSLNLMDIGGGQLVLVCVGEPGIFDSDGYNLFVLTENDALHVTCDNSANWLITSEPGVIYFYSEFNYEKDADPNVPWDLTLDKHEIDMYVGNEDDLIASITPITADQTLIWSSTDPDTVHVDQKGHITALAEGTASIFAASAADGEIYDWCEVNVFCLHEKVNAIVYDVDSEIYYSEFNTEDPHSWEKLHDTGLGAEALANMMATPEDLYVAALDPGAQFSYMGWVDPETYEPEIFSQSYFPVFDMTQGLLDNPYFDMVYVYGPYLVAGNLAPMEMDGAYLSGLPNAYLNSADTAINAYLAGVACKKIGAEESGYYLLSNDGKIWETKLVFDAETFGANFTEPKLVMETGVSCTYYYQSLYFDGQYLLWTYTGSDFTELFIMDVEKKILYDAGDFGDSVWPVPGLYQYGTVAPGYEETDEGEDGEGDGNGAVPVPVLSRDSEGMTELLAKTAADLKAAAARRNGSDRSSGSLNAVTVSVTKPENPAADAELSGNETESGDVTVSLSEDEDSTNGFMTVSYDPEKLTLKKAESSLDYNSITVDEENGTVKFAYADNADIEAGTVLAELSFEPGCEDEAITVDTAERNKETDLEESSEATVEGEGHEWGEPEVKWSSDHKKAEFVFKCEECGEEETVDAEVTKEEKDDKVIFTATVTGPDGEKYTATYVSEVPKTGTVKETVILAAVSAVSVIALIFLIIMRKKRKEREEEE